ncbi:copper resistance protein B [Stutzerimonas stutzeri]|uniref:copper resistance protein B n=1 Tax=Stutzerimonas stutzeri TaxID=316 RepID=UPI001C2EDE9B|nr:copper resistance protein B [Stutzerimonas stutzeri]
MITDRPSENALCGASGRLSLAIALSLAAATSQAQDAMDHAGHGAPMDHSQMNHGQMDHGAMDHGAMNHGAMTHGAMDHGDMSHGSQGRDTYPPSTGVPPGEETRSPVPTIRDEDRAAAFPELPPHQMHRGGTHFMALADRLEWQDADEGSALAWDLSGWLGGDIDRLAWRSEGERTNGHTEAAELQLLWSHAVSPWWETVVGLRQDFEPGPAQTWAAVGVQGMPLYGVETEVTAFIGERGQTALRLEAEYDMLLTQRWVLQPTAEINLHGRNDESRGVGSGLSEVGAGLRLRYEFSRQFAPYVGISWNRAYGNSADLRHADGEDANEARLVAGVRFWF